MLKSIAAKNILNAPLMKLLISRKSLLCLKNWKKLDVPSLANIANGKPYMLYQTNVPTHHVDNKCEYVDKFCGKGGENV